MRQSRASVVIASLTTDYSSMSNTQSNLDVAASHAALGNDLDKIVRALPQELQFNTRNTEDHAYGYTNDPVCASIYFQLHNIVMLTYALLLLQYIKDPPGKDLWRRTCQSGESIFNSDSTCLERIIHFTGHVEKYAELLQEFHDHSRVVRSSFIVVAMLNIVQTCK